MTRDETKTVLAMMATVYPKNLLPEVTDLTVNVWYQLLQDLPFKTISAAVAAWLATNRYPPTISDLREIVVKRETADQTTPDEAWSRLTVAIRKYGHTQPDMAAGFLGDLWQTIKNDWPYYCGMLESEMPNEKARFIRMYTAKSKRDKEQLQIPQQIRKALSGIGQQRLEAGND
jgi:hypothetical protein